MNERITALEAQIAKLKAQHAAELAQLQKTCPHTMQSEDDGGPPLRVCEECGLSEEGWHCGFIVLKADRLRQVSTRTARTLQRGLCIRADDKGPLLRREVKLGTLINRALGIGSSKEGGAAS